MPAIDYTRCFPPGNSGTSAYHQRESADGLSFLLHPRFSGVWFFSFDSMCDIVKLSSVRGRKPSVVCPCFLISNEFPARGRKPARLDDLIDVDVNYNLSPQGDGNFSLSQFIRLSSKLQFIPARGRKPFLLFTFIIYHYCNLSPQGDKKAPLPLAFASSGGALLFPIFYFTGWELRLPGSSL